MGNLLGRPKSTAAAQLRLMLPIAIISAFLNNTPVVAVMIPIVQRWGKNIGVSPQQLLVPLSFASILGGTCTLIGTSTNLVVAGLLKDRFPSSDVANIGLFDLGLYGVPVMFAGISYILIFSPCLLPGGKHNSGDLADGTIPDNEAIYLGARLTKWSNAAGRSVKRSGLRDTGGIYLVSVDRAATGNVHRAVGQDFVLNVGDILYFTGLVEGFGEFCEEHGLEVITNEVEGTLPALRRSSLGASAAVEGKIKNETQYEDDISGKVIDIGSYDEEDSDNEETKKDDSFENEDEKESFLHTSDANQHQLFLSKTQLGTIQENEQSINDRLLGTTKESLVSTDSDERMRSINRLADKIRGIAPSSPSDEELTPGTTIKITAKNKNTARRGQLAENEPTKIVAVVDKQSEQRLVIIGVNCYDRPGLLLDISKGLLRLGLQLHHTEAAVVGTRSLSIWRCEVMKDGGSSDIGEIWNVLNSVLEKDTGAEAIKKRGLRVIRATVTKYSRLIGRSANEVDFRETYKAAIVAIQGNQANKKGTDSGDDNGKNLSNVQFSVGDVLILQASDDSPLLKRPPQGFYKKQAEQKTKLEGSRIPSVSSFVNLMKRRPSFSSQASLSSVDTNPTFSPPKKTGITVPADSTLNTVEKDIEMQGEQNISTESDDDDFYIPDEESEAKEQAQDKPEEESKEKEKEDTEEEVWKDLKVVFRTSMEGSLIQGPDVNREFLTAMKIAPKSAFAKKTATQAGLHKLAGVVLVGIERPLSPEEDRNKVIASLRNTDAASLDGSLIETEQTLTPVGLDEILQAGDILWFAGSASAVGDLRKIPGLKSFETDQVKKINEKVHDRRLVQAVVARKGPLVGKTVAETKFRTRYGAAVIAVTREGKRVHEHPGKVILQAGDVLLLEAGPTFIERNTENDRSFALLSEVAGSAPPRLQLFWPALILTIVMLAVVTAGLTELIIAALIASGIMIAIGILSQQEARDAINWDVYVTIASAFGIGTALTNSGLAGLVASGLVSLGEGLNIGDAGLFGSVYFATFLISNVVTNNAAAALIFPIAIDAAEQFGTDILLMSYCVMLGASASFMSPFGYTTNLLIYGPGGYKYKDFLKIGTPMQVVLWILSVGLLSLSPDRWYFGWIFTGATLVVTMMFQTLDISSCFA